MSDMKINRPRTSMADQLIWLYYRCDRYRISYALAFLFLFWLFVFSGNGTERSAIRTSKTPKPNLQHVVDFSSSGSTVLRVPADPDPRIESYLKSRIPAQASASSPSDSCSVTSQVKLHIPPEEGHKNWTLQAIALDGTEKKVGGDEFYITYTDNSQKDGGTTQEEYPAAVAIVLDHNDGSYELDFVRPPLTDSASASNQQKKSKITIYFQYTCGIGHMAPPTKDDWLDGGSIPYKYEIETSHRPPIRPFALPPSRGSLAKFETVLAFGDSAMKQFVKNNSRAYEPNLIFRIKNRKPWTTALIEQHLTILHKQFGRDLDDTANRPVNTTALILGSSIWDVLASHQESNANRHLQSSITSTNPIFENHVRACRHFIQTVRHEYPNVILFWKSPTAMHIHVVDPSSPINAAKNTAAERVRYMSTSRMDELYVLQMQLMAQLQVPILDIYQATYLSASWTFPGDGRHYRPELHRHMISWFYR